MQEDNSHCRKYINLTQIVNMVTELKLEKKTALGADTFPHKSKN